MTKAVNSVSLVVAAVLGFSACTQSKEIIGNPNRESGETKALEEPKGNKKKKKKVDGDLIVKNVSDNAVSKIISGDGGNGIYLSIAHLAQDGIAAKDLDVYRYGITKALNSISVKPEIVKLDAVDDAGLVLRLDLAEFGLSNNDWNTIKKAPYAEDNIEQIEGATVVKGDWLVYAVTRPETYDVLMRIPPTVTMLEGQLRVDPKKAAYIMVQASEVTFAERILERIPINTAGKPGGYYWRSYDFARADVAQKGQANPEALRTAGIPDLVAGEFFFSLPNGLQGYMLSGFGLQHRYDAQAFVATDANRTQDGLRRCVGGVSHCGYVINGESCITCHTAGVKLAPKVKGVKGATREEFDDFFAKDIARFQTAIDEMGYPEVHEEPVRVTLTAFKEDRGIEDKRAQGGEIEGVTGSLAAGSVLGR